MWGLLSFRDLEFLSEKGLGEETKGVCVASVSVGVTGLGGGRVEVSLWEASQNRHGQWWREGMVVDHREVGVWQTFSHTGSFVTLGAPRLQ